MPQFENIGFFVNRDHLKDLSFENPRGPVTPEQAAALSIGVSGNVASREAGAANTHVVDTTLRITGSGEGTVRFICELTYSAEVELHNIPPPVQEQVLCVDVPTYLVAKINEVIDHAGRAGGLPGLKVDKTDFGAIYRGARRERASAAN
jgi:preprotein translocase subunit SecB